MSYQIIGIYRFNKCAPKCALFFLFPLPDEYIHIYDTDGTELDKIKLTDAQLKAKGYTHVYELKQQLNKDTHKKIKHKGEDAIKAENLANAVKDAQAAIALRMKSSLAKDHPISKEVFEKLSDDQKRQAKAFGWYKE